MSGAAYRPADQKLVFHVTEKVSPQQTSVTNTYIPHQSSVTSNHSNNSSRSTGSRRLLSTGSSKQDSVQDVETNPTVRFSRVCGKLLEENVFRRLFNCSHGGGGTFGHYP